MNDNVRLLGGDIIQTTVLNISGINNTNTAIMIKNMLSSITGVSNVSVDVDTSKLTITYDPSATDLSTIKNSITDKGFTVH